MKPKEINKKTKKQKQHMKNGLGQVIDQVGQKTNEQLTKRIFSTAISTKGTTKYEDKSAQQRYTISKREKVREDENHPENPQALHVEIIQSELEAHEDENPKEEEDELIMARNNAIRGEGAVLKNIYRWSLGMFFGGSDEEAVSQLTKHLLGE